MNPQKSFFQTRAAKIFSILLSFSMGTAYVLYSKEKEPKKEDKYFHTSKSMAPSPVQVQEEIMRPKEKKKEKEEEAKKEKKKEEEKKKKEKSEKQESKKPKLDPVMPSTKAPSFIQ
ncbi:MAG: hypothetical protein H7A25_14485 [Leptospiraceae bacterium]|nr:hypothetical protein [Leptospiraceae bacterium]MCP5501112.1 hypothetical protein [Leptospiraceae bacterium]